MDLYSESVSTLSLGKMVIFMHSKMPVKVHYGRIGLEIPLSSKRLLHFSRSLIKDMHSTADYKSNDVKNITSPYL